jgi:hypothetical protein
MYPLKIILKYLLVGGCGLAGVLSLSRGFGMPIPFLEYGALEAWNVLVGAGLLSVSLCSAFFWHVQRNGSTKGDEELRNEWLVPATTATKPHRTH